MCSIFGRDIDYKYRVVEDFSMSVYEDFPLYFHTVEKIIFFSFFP